MVKSQRLAVPAKISHPRVLNVIQRRRLFNLLDKNRGKPLTWISAPAGSGKTTLITSYLGAKKIPSLWYQCDEGDSDLPTFFYYMGLAAGKAAPRYKKPLPLLTPEYLGDISTFSRRYFEELFRRILETGMRRIRRSANQPSPTVTSARFILVLDNYQDVPLDSPFHGTIANSFDRIPEGLHVMVISRSDPPPQFSRLLASEKIRLLESDIIRFTLEESRELARGRIPTLDNQFIKAMYEKTEGWAAGITLMLERARLEGTATNLVEDLAYDKVFNYFAEEIFYKSEKRIQDFLLKTAFLPVLNIPLTRKLTDMADAGRILSVLNRSHFFTERLSGTEPYYRYHPLFRDFLINRAKAEFGSRELALIRRRAGLFLEQSGKIEEAASLYSNAGDEDGLVRILNHHARELLSQGRNKTLQEWIAGIPEEQADDHPWLLYWKGISFFPFDISRAREYLEKAFEIFEAKADPSGLYLSWAGMVDTYAFELDEWKHLDDWIGIFNDLQRSYSFFPSKEIDLIASSRMLISLTLRKTDRVELVERWLKRVLALLQENPSLDIQMDTLFCMSLYYLWVGEYEKNGLLLEKAEEEIPHHKASPFSAIRIKLMRGVHYWVTAEYDSALKTLSEGLEISEKNGIHVFDSLLWCFRAAAEMAPGKLKLAKTSLTHQMKSLTGMSKTLDVFFYHINSAWYALLKGNPSLAEEHMEAISPKVAKMGTPYYTALYNIGMAQTAFLQGRRADAKAHIQKAHRISLTMKSHVMEWYSLLINAYFLLKEGREREGLLSLRSALSLGKKRGYIHLEFYQPSVMQFLYAKALEQGIEEDYVKGVIRKLNLTPPDGDSGYLPFENWPYPLKIYTLGRFEILLNEKPIPFSKKVPKKPLDLLKALIALGGNHVPYNKISDALWSDAEGDAAYRSFKVNLHLLRKLLGTEDAVLTGEGRISLNLQYCYVDVLAFQHLASKITELGADEGKGDTKEILSLAQKAIGIYKGNFLESEMAYPNITGLRERLRNKFTRLVEMTGSYYETKKQWQKAVELYEKGIETDALQEEFYKSLMLCYGKLGRKSEVARVYDRCRRMLHLHFGLEPSSGMKALREKLITQ